MKRFLFALLILGMSTIFFSCEKDNSGSSDLAGSWLLIEEGEECNGKYTKFDDNGQYCLYTFTKSTLTVTDERDLMNGIATEYELKGNSIWLMGIEWFKIITLNSDILKLKCLLPITNDEGPDSYTISTFERVE